jgi:hypothetical protein
MNSDKKIFQDTDSHELNQPILNEIQDNIKQVIRDKLPHYFLSE